MDDLIIYLGQQHKGPSIIYKTNLKHIEKRRRRRMEKVFNYHIMGPVEDIVFGELTLSRFGKSSQAT
jgi:hypothetical protein